MIVEPMLIRLVDRRPTFIYYTALWEIRKTDSKLDHQPSWDGFSNSWKQRQKSCCL